MQLVEAIWSIWCSAACDDTFFHKIFLFAREAFFKGGFKISHQIEECLLITFYPLSLYVVFKNRNSEMLSCTPWMSYKRNFIPPSICLLTHMRHVLCEYEHCIKQNHKTFCSFWFKWIVVQFLFRWLTLYKCLRNAFEKSELNGQYMVA